ncbi:hypothetical protein [Mycolicibacterium porcinum]|uniref:hypothetical protein n=1 Tax=Mycolicibacterium porcinum TaxID=39693 RepID=UPI00084842CA|nr:hypothetical protein [Mycolicibacterium porcinum]ODR24326.1 hypothetical protein BHQ19_16850 [Mycolicibacterium porcinum]
MNWGDLWEYPFLASVWGTVNGWAGTIVTAGSFFIAALVYRKNREDQRRAQASLIVFTNYYTSTFGEDDMVLVTIRGGVHNHSPALITNASIVVVMTNKTARQRLSWIDRWFRPRKKVIARHPLREGSDITDTILPGEDRRYMVEIPYDENLAAEQVVIKLTFMDANSADWERPYRGAPVEPKRPGRIRRAIITRLYWRDWEKEHPEIEETPDPKGGEWPKVPHAEE